MAAAAGGLLGGLLGAGSTIEQLFIWNVLGQVLGALLGPYLVQAQNDVNSANPVVPLSPAEAALAWMKTILTQEQAVAWATQSGISAEALQIMYDNVGEPPGLVQVLEWARRGFLPFGDAGPGVPSVPEAVRTSRIRNDWLPVILQAQYLPISAADAVNAWVRNQISPELADQILEWNGILKDQRQILYDTTGRPPAPTELAHLVRIGAIPLRGTGPDALSLQQGIYEGDLKDKWEPAFEALLNVYPGVFEIRQMQITGSIDGTTAAGLYKIAGAPDNLTAALVSTGSGAKLAGSKKLTETLALKLYTDGVVTAAQVEEMLVALGYDSQDAAYLVSLEDLQTEMRAVDAAVTHVRALFIARKLTSQRAATALATLKVPASTVTQLLQTWQLERDSSVRVLTEAQIVDALDYGVIDQPTAQDYLQGLGYSPYDAWVLISVKLKSPQPNQPAEGMNVQGAAQ